MTFSDGLYPSISTLCSQCGGLTNKWLASSSTGICGMCSASNKIAVESGDNVSKESVWKQTQGAGSGYYRREPKISLEWEFVNWNSLPVASRPTNRAMAENLIELWRDNCGGTLDYALVQCSKCHEFHNQGWIGSICDSCGGNMVCTKCGVYIKQSYQPLYMPALCKNCHMVKAQAVVAKAKASGINPPLTLVMKNGDIRKLPKANSPMWTDQWAVQGSARAPYVVSRKSQGGDSGNLTEEGWACSCPDFIHHTPRVDCKHIIRVQKVEGLISVVPKVGANIPASQAAAFEKFLKQEKHKKLAAASDGAEVKMTAFDITGRKFR